MEKKNIAVIAGGYSSESVVAIKSAQTILENLNTAKFNSYLILIYKDKWYAKIGSKEFVIDKNDFSFELKEQKITFDCAYITIHGTPGEDGKLQGYFDMLGIPYSTSSQQASTLTFNKWATNQILIENGFNCAKSLILYKENEYSSEYIIQEIGIPCFVKPNDGGSSFGISKVNQPENLGLAIQKAFNEGKQVIVESFLQGKEVTCGAYKYKNKVYTLPLTEIVSHNEYFDYEAKYEGLSDEITPARIPENIRSSIELITKQIYQLLNLSGIVRIDYMIHKETPFIIEVNTTPGMSKESLIPQQVYHQENLNLKDLLGYVIEEAIADM